MKKLLMGTLALALVFGLMPTPARACCGVYPYIDAVNVALRCFYVTGTITGTIRGVEIWPGAYSTTARVEVEILSPSSAVTNLPATLSNLKEFKDATPPYATWDYSVTYTPEEVGTYTYVVKVYWTSAFGWEMLNTAAGTFDVTYCLTPGKVTGGGWIMTGDVKNTFGFNAQSADGSSVKGNVEFQAHNFLNLKSTAISTLYVNGNFAVISGECSINGEEGYTFVLIVEDNGEPGNGVDKFTISWAPAVNGFTSVGMIIDQGNIQIHK